MLPMLSLVLFVCIGKYNLNDVFEDAYRPPLLFALKAQNSYSAVGRRGKQSTAVWSFLQLLGYDLEKGIFLFNPQHWALSLRCPVQVRTQTASQIDMQNK